MKSKTVSDARAIPGRAMPGRQRVAHAVAVPVNHDAVHRAAPLAVRVDVARVDELLQAIKQSIIRADRVIARDRAGGTSPA